jgi:hypothetical protein
MNIPSAQILLQFMWPCLHDRLRQGIKLSSVISGSMPLPFSVAPRPPGQMSAGSLHPDRQCSCLTRKWGWGPGVAAAVGKSFLLVVPALIFS